MKPRHFWWLHEWKTRGDKKKKKGLQTADRNKLLRWMDETNDPPPDS
jgi:hypothetical protein